MTNPPSQSPDEDGPRPHSPGDKGVMRDHGGLNETRGLDGLALNVISRDKPTNLPWGPRRQASSRMREFSPSVIARDLIRQASAIHPHLSRDQIGFYSGAIAHAIRDQGLFRSIICSAARRYPSLDELALIDCVANAFAQIVHGWSLGQEIDDFDAYARSSIRHRVCSYLRAQKNHLRSLPEKYDASNPRSRGDFDPADFLDLKNAIAQLKPKYRRAVIAQYFKGKSIEEFAHDEGINPSCAASRRQRALLMLRKMLRGNRDE